MATILVVDDRPINREFLVTLLGCSGHRLLEAEDGLDALERTRADHPDLIITDILMPNMDGLEFARRLHADPAIDHIPILFYTATYRASEAMLAAQSCGVAGVLAKPSEPKAILDAVNTVLGIDLPAELSIPAALHQDQRRVQQGPVSDKLAAHLNDLEQLNLRINQTMQRGLKLIASNGNVNMLSRDVTRSFATVQTVGLRLAALVELGLELVSERDPLSLLDTSCRAAQDILSAKYAAIGVLDQQGTDLAHLFVRGFGNAANSLRADMRPRAGLLGRALSEGRAQRQGGLKGNPRTVGLPAAHPPINSFLAVPIVLPTRPYGWLYVADKLGADEFDSDDERFAMTLAAQLASTQENLMLYQEIQRRSAALEREIVVRKTRESRIEYLATHDALTDLPNRNLLSDRILQAVVHARRTGEHLGVLFLDLDRFKYLNNSYGHSLGDALLRTVAGRLKEVVREGDTVSRLGGDEFVILLLGITHAEDAAGVAQKVLDELTSPFRLDGHELYATASIGVALYPEDGQTADTLLKNADAAMYRAKEGGRNRFEFYTPEMGRKVHERVTLEGALRLALQAQEFELHYQPQVDLMNGQIVGVEALVRWRHPQLGMVAPSRFVSLAEDTGLIVSIGEWVLRTACIQAKLWHAAGYPELSVAVNLSARQFGQQNLVDLVRRVLKDAALDAARLELELTESTVMENTERVIQTLTELKAIGVGLVMDDFGTGYSSLSYLKRFPIDVLKIDQSFIRELTTSRDDASITGAIIAMARSLSIRTIAEGVETEGQASILIANKCDQIQGHLFSPAVPPAQIEAMLREGRRLPAHLFQPQAG